jgi:predicted ferric reductase
VLVGLVHVLRVNHYISAPWKQAFWALMTGAAIFLLVQVRILKPLRMLKRPYTVTDVKREPVAGPAVWTVTLEPANHPGMRFTPGQFAWLTLGISPFSLEQHPFSFVSSAAAPGAIQFTIKDLGDYTARTGEVKTAARAYLEGPYGAFTLDDDAPGGAFIVGGIGITPVMSILRTLRDRGDRRPLVLLYANLAEDRIVFRSELEELRRELNLQIVHIVEEAPASTDGTLAVGRITPQFLDSHLPRLKRGFQYLICGPEPLMDMAERHLLERGVPLTSLRSERFNIA